MKIGLANTYSYNNVGDAAIYAALNKMLLNHEVHTSLLDAEGNAPYDMVYDKKLDDCDGFISVGGDIFNNARPGLITRNFLKNAKQLGQLPSKTFLFGQSIPSSCYGLSLWLLVRQLKKISSVIVRDQKSYDLLVTHGVNCKLSFDTAFSLDCSIEAVQYAKRILKEMDAPRSAVISLREFNSLYPSDNQAFIDNIALLSKKLLAKNYQPILLIQSCVSDMDSDWLIAREIQKYCPEVKTLDFVSHGSQFPSWELLQAVLKVSDIIVAVRYHTAVLALAAGRIPYNLYYSNKGEDLSNRLGIAGNHVSLFNPENEFEAIEKTAQQAFDIGPIREKVIKDFSEALNDIVLVNIHEILSA